MFEYLPGLSPVLGPVVTEMGRCSKEFAVGGGEAGMQTHGYNYGVENAIEYNTGV